MIPIIPSTIKVIYRIIAKPNKTILVFYNIIPVFSTVRAAKNVVRATTIAVLSCI